jgi:hypothetical protein
MNRVISYRVCQLVNTAILILTLTVLAVAQKNQIIQEKQSAGHHITGTVTMKPDNQPVAKAMIELTAIGNKPAGVKPFTNQIFTDEQGV